MLRWVAPLQVQPLHRRGRQRRPPTRFTLPAAWLLEGPGQFQDHWARLVVVPELAAWHDLYLVALTLLAAAVALPGRYRRRLAVVGASVAVVAVLLQASVTP